ncbi:hypothetical protein [Methylobacterium oxalidis]|uniref:Uncharacterized protein n=1 Tax=Methylobacterium oxalidis TaxID=944322 RepID=A0A512JD48_9HYPH|nr:hypothetical protein [Methylobacterium oxalidis]GEP07890.1 hypothetical protein MOX02_59280 [Methylobacterium oxalidis]GLS64852.1 hypothetical protein GCM10007888_32330 [Methylobacterium oxalidis]
MEAHTYDLEARIVAIEYALQVIVNCLSDRDALDREKLIRLLGGAAEEAKTTAAIRSVSTALQALAEQL